MTSVNKFEEQIAPYTGGGLFSQGIETLQINMGNYCNQKCSHCHLEASPQRREIMSWDTMKSILEVLEGIECDLDLTGGAPELNPHFRAFVTAIRKAGHSLQVRTNLTALLEPGMEKTADFMREKEVQLAASLPCYLEKNVDVQRGRGVYGKSLMVLKRLNELGYGIREGLTLNLVYNPGGACLPPEQIKLEADYRRELLERFGIRFNNLLTITNMPIGRFKKQLADNQEEEQYLHLLEQSFNPHTIARLMCRRQLSVGWDGCLYDCDFNLAQKLPVNHEAPDNIRYFDHVRLTRRQINTGNHCFGCTAGFGSSCKGVLLL